MITQNIKDIREIELAPIHILADLLKSDQAVQSNDNTSKIANELVARLDSLEGRICHFCEEV